MFYGAISKMGSWHSMWNIELGIWWQSR